MKATISENDFKELKELILKHGTEGRRLGQIMAEACVVDEDRVPKKTVRLNSKVELLYHNSETPVQLTLVLPEEADVKNRRISVFAPLGAALIGRAENDLIQWDSGSGGNRVKIVSISNE